MPRPRTAALLVAAVLSLATASACSDDETAGTADSTGTSAPQISLPAESGFAHGGGTDTSTPSGTAVLSPDEEMQQWCDTYPGVALGAEDAVVKFTEGAVCPGYVTVRSGTPVSFKNLTDSPQTVQVTDAADAELAASPEIAPGATWSHTLDEVATYNFYTSALPDLRGSIEVQAAA